MSAIRPCDIESATRDNVGSGPNLAYCSALFFVLHEGIPG
jgi:hypothetical protein